MTKLSTEIKLLLPIDSRSKVDELVVLLRQRNTVIDTNMCKRICDYIANPQLEEYFFNTSIGNTLKVLRDIKDKDENVESVLSLLDLFKPLDSKANIDKLVDAIKEKGGVISSNDKTNIYLKIWGAELKTYWTSRCLRELKVTYLPPQKEKTIENRKTNEKKNKKRKSFSFANKYKSKRRTPGILDPNSSDYNNQVLKEKLKSKYAGYEYGLSDW